MTSILEQRRIEANVIAKIYQTLAGELGDEQAQKLLSKAIHADAHAAGAALAEKDGGNTDLARFADWMDLWKADDALQIELLESTPTKLSFNVQRCRYAETYDKMGLRDMGGMLSCDRDGELCRGYDSRIKLTRTQTIMGGAPHCDFRFEIVEDGDG